MMPHGSLHVFKAIAVVAQAHSPEIPPLGGVRASGEKVLWRLRISIPENQEVKVKMP